MEIRMYFRKGYFVTVFVVFISSTYSCPFNPCANMKLDFCKGKNCFVDENCEIYCTCDKNLTLDECKNVTFTSTSKLPEAGGVQLKTTALAVTPGNSFNRTYNVCDSAYILRPESERICNGWPCRYGKCEYNGSFVWCNCDSGAIGTNCNTRCCRNCLHGSCVYDNKRKTEICNCYANYSGPNCKRWDPPTTYAPPAEGKLHYWVVGACVVVLLILIVLILIVPYILWRNRVILVMKFVHYFQAYEDDDDRQWDCFISYKSNQADEQFVVKTLVPTLEKEMGFKVNVHYKDFLPGETIANNIICAVQCSRRTIMVITPSYVTSEFTKFEYQVAQQEMLKRKHRIIPILLDDISECIDTMDSNLKVILNSVTYLEWPKDGDEKKVAKFWKRMELSMPKIKNRTLEIDENKGQTNGFVSIAKPDDINISVSD